MHRLVAAAQQAQDLTPVRVPQRFERIPTSPSGRHRDQCPAPAPRLSPGANRPNDGPRSGIDRQTAFGPDAIVELASWYRIGSAPRIR